MRPKSYGSSTIGVKKSTVWTIARSSVSRTTPASSAVLGADEHARVRRARQGRDDRAQVGGGQLAAAAGAVRQGGEGDGHRARMMAVSGRPPRLHRRRGREPPCRRSPTRRGSNRPSAIVDASAPTLQQHPQPGARRGELVRHRAPRSRCSRRRGRPTSTSAWTRCGACSRRRRGVGDAGRGGGGLRAGPRADRRQGGDLMAADVTVAGPLRLPPLRRRRGRARRPVPDRQPEGGRVRRRGARRRDPAHPRPRRPLRRHGGHRQAHGRDGARDRRAGGRDRRDAGVENVVDPNIGGTVSSTGAG